MHDPCCFHQIVDPFRCHSVGGWKEAGPNMVALRFGNRFRSFDWSNYSDLEEGSHQVSTCIVYDLENRSSDMDCCLRSRTTNNDDATSGLFAAAAAVPPPPGGRR